MKRLSLYANLAGGGSTVYHLHKASFTLQQRNIYYLTTKFVENIEKVTPTQPQINSSNPIISLKRVMRSTNNSLLDTQDVRNRGHG